MSKSHIGLRNEGSTAYLCWSEKSQLWDFLGLRTQPDLLRKGYATQLIREAQGLSEVNAMRLFVEPFSHQSMTEVQLFNFYTKMGFIETRRTKSGTIWMEWRKQWTM